MTKAIKICEKHGEYETKNFEFFGHLYESPCPECERLQEEALLKEEQRKREFYLKKDMLRRGIEEEYFNADFSGFVAENESEQKALNAAKELADGKILKMLLLGGNGTGKTYLGCALARKLGGIRITMYELTAKIRDGYNKNISELSILNDLLSYPLIVLDEIGRTKGSDAEKNWLSYLIDKAHTRHIKLLLISNRHTAKTLSKDKQGEAIENYFDNDVISRLRQNSKIVEVKGRDRRANVFCS